MSTKKKSPVWKYIVSSENAKEGRCRICMKTVLTSGNTSNAWTHLAQHGVTKSNALDETNLNRRGGTALREAEGENSTEPGTARRRRRQITDSDAEENVEDNPAAEAETETSRGASSSSLQLPRLANAHANAAVSEKRPRTSAGGTQLTIGSALQRASSFKAGGEKDAELRDALLFMQMRQNLPLSFCEGEGFRHFASKTVPLWSPPSRRTMTRAMEDKFSVLSELVKNDFAELSTACLTADCWSDQHNTSSYLGVTVHYPVKGEMMSACIGLLQLTQAHTGLYLSEKLLEFCKEWRLDTLKIEGVVVDNAENIKLAVKTAFGETKLVTCFAHTLNLIPKAALGTTSDNSTPNVLGVPALIKKVKAIVTFSHTSNNFSDEIKRIQVEQFNKPYSSALRLINDVVTRWGSTYLMIKRFLEMQPVLLLATAKFPDIDMVTATELASLRSIMDILEPIHEATTEMSLESATTISKVIPLASIIQKAVANVAVAPADAMAKRFKQFVLDELVRRFGNGEHNTRQAASTILDPRFMEVYFQSPLAVAKARKFIETEIAKEIILECTEPVDNTEGNANAAVPAAPLASSRLWSSHAELAAARSSANTDDVQGRALSELRGFLQRSIVDVKQNPLQVWETLRPLYPHLYLVARRLLGVLASSVPSERFFSTAGDIADEKASRLTPKHLQQRIFLKSVDLNNWEKSRLKNVDF